MCQRGQINRCRTSGTESGISASCRSSSLSRPRGQRLGPLDSEEGVRPERRGDVLMPPRPTAHLVLVQAHPPLAALEALLDRPPGARLADDVLQERVWPGEHAVLRQLRRGREAAAEEHAPNPRARRFCGSARRPTRPPGTLRCLPGTQPQPDLGRNLGCQRAYPDLMEAAPEAELAADGQQYGCLRASSARRMRQSLP